MWEDFLVRALVAGALVALVAGPLGAFVVWRRMAYFGDTVSHAALLGIALGFVAGVNLSLAVTVTSVLLAVTLLLLQSRQTLASDTLLGILAHGTLSIGLVVVSFLDGLRVDLMAYLFGDILAVASSDLVTIAAGVVVALALLAWLWRPLLAVTVHADLAQVEGVPVVWVQLGLMLIIALVIASAMQVVGVLLITALLIIPAASARSLARTPEQMALAATFLGMLAVAGGLAGSWHWDTPAGPSIVVAALIGFVVMQVVSGLASALRRAASR